MQKIVVFGVFQKRYEKGFVRERFVAEVFAKDIFQQQIVHLVFKVGSDAGKLRRDGLGRGKRHADQTAYRKRFGSVTEGGLADFVRLDAFLQRGKIVLYFVPDVQQKSAGISAVKSPALIAGRRRKEDLVNAKICLAATGDPLHQQVFALRANDGFLFFVQKRQINLRAERAIDLGFRKIGVRRPFHLKLLETFEPSVPRRRHGIGLKGIKDDARAARARPLRA